MIISKYRIIVALVLVFCLNCKTKQEVVTYTYLEKLSGKKPSSYRVIDGKLKNIYIYKESILIDNRPEDKEKKYKLLREYFVKNNKISLLEDDITEYSMEFWVKNNCTEYFIDNYLEEGGGDFNYNIYDDCENYYAGGYYYKRDEKNSNVWVSRLPKGLNDTIYCNPHRKTIKLPDIKYNE